MDPSGTEKINRKYKALIAVPPVEDFYFTPSRASALGASSLQIILDRLGINSLVLNFPGMKRKPANLQLPHELEHLRPHIIPGESSPLAFFTGWHRYGPSYAECAEIIASFSPEYVFISCFAWAYAAGTISLAAAVKQLMPRTPVIAGGAGVTVNPDFFRNSSNAAFIDYVLPGEAETVIPGFFAVAEPPVSDEPVFSWNETGISRRKGIRYISTMLTRGCPKSCRFCSNHLVHGRVFRKCRIQDIKLYIEEIPDDLNIHVNFEDDNLMFAAEYFFEVLDIIKKRFPNAEFSAENGLDYTLLDVKLVDRLINCGFRSFNLSMASSSQELLDEENRKSSPDRLKTVVEAVTTGGATSTTYFICGLEGESPETVLDNLLTLHRLPTLTGISLFYPVPGLPGFKPEVMNNFHPGLCAGSAAWPWNSSLTTSQMITSFRLARLSNLLKSLDKKIPSTALCESFNHLADVIMNTKTLHSLVKGSTVVVPNQNKELVRKFLEFIK